MLTRTRPATKPGQVQSARVTRPVTVFSSVSQPPACCELPSRPVSHRLAPPWQTGDEFSFSFSFSFFFVCVCFLSQAVWKQPPEWERLNPNLEIPYTSNTIASRAQSTSPFPIRNGLNGLPQKTGQRSAELGKLAMLVSIFIFFLSLPGCAHEHDNYPSCRWL